MRTPCSSAAICAVINNIRDSNATSFFTAQTDSVWLTGSCISGCPGNPGSLNPAGFGFPAVDPSFGPSYDYAVTALTGLITVVDRITISRKT